MLSLGIGALNLRFKLALLILYHLLAPLSLHDSLFSYALKVLLALSVLFISHLLHSLVGPRLSGLSFSPLVKAV